jgi:hypothetical protein
LGALPQGSAPDADTYQALSDLVDSMLTELEARDVVYVADVDALDDKFLQPLGHMLAWRAAPEFGAGSDQALAALSVQAEMHLKQIESVRPDYTIFGGQYF